MLYIVMCNNTHANVGNHWSAMAPVTVGLQLQDAVVRVYSQVRIAQLVLSPGGKCL